MHVAPKRWVLVLAALLPFEDLLLKFVPMPDVAYLVVRASSELIIYALMFGLFLSHTRRGIHWRWTPIGIVTIIFVACGVASWFLNGGALINVVINMRTLLRYLALYLIVVNLHWEEAEVRTLFKLLLFGVFMQCAIGWAEYFGPKGLMELFEPRATDVKVASVGVTMGDKALKIGAVFGSFGRPGQFALFLLFGCVYIVCNSLLRRRWPTPLEVLGVLFLLGGIYMSYKRGSLLIFFLMFPVLLWVCRRRLLAMTSLAAPVLLVVALLAGGSLGLMGGTIVKEKEAEITPLQSLMQLATDAYWQRTSSVSRGWFILDVGGHAVQDMGPLGYGPDDGVARRQLARNGGVFSKLIEFSAFEDVFWVACFLLYGPVGIALLWGMLGYAFIWSNRLVAAGGIQATIGATACGLIFIAFPANFLERALEMRTFSFYLWAMVGLVFAAHYGGVRSAPPARDPQPA